MCIYRGEGGRVEIDGLVESYLYYIELLIRKLGGEFVRRIYPVSFIGRVDVDRIWIKMCTIYLYSISCTTQLNSVHPRAAFFDVLRFTDDFFKGPDFPQSVRLVMKICVL